MQLCELAAYDLGAQFCMIQMPTPPQTAPVPVKSTGTSWAIQGNRAVIEALKRVEVIVDCTVEGLLHAPEWPKIEEAGNTRLLVITNEHPEILERTDQLRAVGSVMRAAALDLRGYGDSTLGPRQSTVDDYCADILRVAEKLGAKRLVLVGLSYGSWIATSFAMRHPEMLDALVLSGGCTGMSEAGPDVREAFRVSREVPLNAGQTPADVAPAVVKVLASPGASDEVRRRLFDSMAAIPTATYRDALLCFTNPLERFDFARLTMPALMMTGEHDRLAPPAEIRGVAGRIWDAAPRPDVRFEVIAGAGHVCNVEQPAAYNGPLLDLLGRLP